MCIQLGIVRDSSAFLFSLRRTRVSFSDKFRYPGSVMLREKRSISFGSGFDIFIFDQSNIQYGSYCNFGHSIVLPDGYIQYVMKMQLCGNYNAWTVRKIEVY